MNQIVYYKNKFDQYYALKASSTSSMLEGWVYFADTSGQVTVRLADVFLLDPIKEAEVPLAFIDRLKVLGFFGSWQLDTSISGTFKECPKSPSGVHVKGKTPLTNSKNELWIICKYCGKDLELCRK